MLQCPQCGNRTDFAIDAVQYVTAYVTQHTTSTPDFGPGDLEIESTKDYSGSEWDEESECSCVPCGHTAPLATLRVEEEDEEEGETDGE